MVAAIERARSARECTNINTQDVRMVANALFNTFGGTIIGGSNSWIRVVANREVMVRNRGRNGRIVPIAEVDHNISFYRERIVQDEEGEHLERVLLGGSRGASPVGALTSLDIRYKDLLIDHMHAKVQRFNSSRW